MKKSSQICSRIYRMFLAEQPCLICGAVDSSAAHQSSRRWANSSDLDCLPLCVMPCHRKYDDMGRNKERFLFEKTGMAPMAHVIRLQGKFRREHKLPNGDSFENVLRDAGMLDAPRNTKANAKPFTKKFIPLHERN